MVLIFKVDLNQPLEQVLASGRYAQFWQKRHGDILASFYQHTGMHFRQRKIIIRTWGRDTSRAGNRGMPMQLTSTLFDESRIGGVLIHELAHRLLIGNGIEPLETPSTKLKAAYHMHRHIDLFLYDILRDILGGGEADKEVALEISCGGYYRKAWEWAQKLDYDERQAAFRRLKRRYSVVSSRATLLRS